MAAVTCLPKTSLAPVARDRGERRIRVAFWIAALLAAGVQAWALRDSMSSDGVSYLDMGSAVARGDWAAAINGYWSPLYPLLIALALWIAKPAPLHEFALVHAVNFIVFMGAFASFDFLLRRVSRGWLTRVAGYCVATWALVELVTTSGVSPDMAVAAFVFLAMALLAGIAQGDTRARSFLLLGAILGLGYYAKAPLFPLAFVCLALTLLSPAGIRRTFPKTLLAGLMFAVVASPLVLLLSGQKHRLTFGDSGALNYAWYVDGATYRHWQGEPLGGRSEIAPRWTKGPVSTGIPAHPTRQILVSPPVFEFDGPPQGTYPLWADPSYWNDGLRAPFDTKQQLRKIAVNSNFLYSLLLNVHGMQLFRNGQWYRMFSPVLLAVWLALFWKVRPTWRTLNRLHRLLLLFPAAALGMYLLVYCEPRHVAAFVAVLYLGLFATLEHRLPGTRGVHRNLAAAALLGALAVTTGASTVRFAIEPSSGFEAREVASGLEHMGIAPGARVASLDYSNHRNVRWARLARARIVAEMYLDAYAPQGAYWRLEDAARARVLAAFRHAGASIVVDSNLPDVSGSGERRVPAGWEQIGNTRYFMYRLRVE